METSYQKILIMRKRKKRGRHERKKVIYNSTPSMVNTGEDNRLGNNRDRVSRETHNAMPVIKYGC